MPKRTKSVIFPRSCCKSSIASDMKRKLHFLFSLFVLSSPLLHHWWHSVWKQKQDTRQRRKKQFSDDRKCHETKLSKQREFRIYLLDRSILKIAIANNFLQIVCLDNFFAKKMSDNFWKIFILYHFLQILQINQYVSFFFKFCLLLFHSTFGNCPCG